MNRRLVQIDEIKGLAIILVVMGHVLAWNGLGGGKWVFTFPTNLLIPHASFFLC